MSKKKEYNQGVESGIKVSQRLIEKESEAMDYLKSRIDLIVDGHDEMNSAVEKLIADADENEVRRIYDICNTIRPVDLKDHEKKLLLNVLSTLGRDGQNDQQKKYLNNIRHHIGLHGYEPDTSYDFRLVAELESVKSIKVIAKAVRIYLYLKYLNMDGIYEHEDDLFSNFELRSYDEIDGIIETIVCLFGEEGLVEMYGNYSDLTNDDSATEGDETQYDDLEEYVLAEDVVKPLFIENRNVIVKGRVSCFDTIMLNKCKVTIAQESGNIVLIGGKIHISESLIECKGEQSHIFICRGVSIEKKKFHKQVKHVYDGSVLIEKSIFKNCYRFANVDSFDLFNCKLYDCYLDFAKADHICISNCLWENSKVPSFMKRRSPQTGEYMDVIDQEVISGSNSVNISNIIIRNSTGKEMSFIELWPSASAIIREGEFHSIKELENTDRVEIVDCIFENNE